MISGFWIIDQLVQQGVFQFCIAPGSRCTPLVLATADHKMAKTTVHYDERGLGFYALGTALGSNRPAAIIVTSGTAVGNLLPCIMEAHQSRIPLILLTADRPADLRDCGANQNTDQTKIFAPFIRWQADLPPEESERYFRTIVAQAVFHASQNPPGPVHLNCQFREPFCFEQKGTSRPPISLSYPKLIPAATQVNDAKGIILIGRQRDSSPILEMAKRLKWPVFADILSQARSFSSEEQIHNFDWILKRGTTLKPDLILHFGERLTSKKLLEWLNSQQPCRYIHVGPNSSLLDPARLVSERIQADEEEFCTRFTAASDPTWLPAWKAVDQEIETILNARFGEGFSEAHAMRSIGKNFPPGWAAYFGSGMPIRDADRFFFPKNCAGYFSNRGLSGIDGNLATAAGLSDSLDKPLLAFIGDQACLHDLNSLSLIKKTKHPILLIVSNNFGSGMFSHLPIANSPHVDRFFANPHALTFEKAAEMFGIPYLKTDDDPAPFLRISTSTLLEIHTSRLGNFRFQKELNESCLLQPV